VARGNFNDAVQGHIEHVPGKDMGLEIAAPDRSAVTHKADKDSDGCEFCSIAWEYFIDIVMLNYADLVLHFEAALSVCAILGLPKLWRPFSLIFEGPSGAAKSTVMNVILGTSSKEVQDRLYRSDKFTPAAFVSQAANVSKKDLAKIHLLPRIKNRILLTPELGPTFRGKPQEVEDRWATVARVLDGRGLRTDSGTQGRQGFEGDFPFCWIGATTYLPSAAFAAMANVGNRVFFFDTHPPRPTLADLTRVAMRGGSGENESACSNACDSLLYHYFTQHYGDHPESPILCPEIGQEAGQFLSSAAWSIARLRATGIPEYEYRIVEALSELARARAAIQGHTQVQPFHLAIIRHIVASACKLDLRAAMSIALRYESITATELQDLLKCTRDTALKRMEDLAKTGVFHLFKGRAHKPSVLELSENAAYLGWGQQSSTISGECVQQPSESQSSTF